jgi:hypothetical protein
MPIPFSFLFSPEIFIDHSAFGLDVVTLAYEFVSLQLLNAIIIEPAIFS